MSDYVVEYSRHHRLWGVHPQFVTAASVASAANAAANNCPLSRSSAVITDHSMIGKGDDYYATRRWSTVNGGMPRNSTLKVASSHH